MPDQPEHPAAAAVGEAGHGLQLGLPMVALGLVRRAPRRLAPGYLVVGHHDPGASMRPELLDRFLERLELHPPKPPTDFIARLRRLGKRLVNPVHLGKLGIIALEEKLVR